MITKTIFEIPFQASTKILALSGVAIVIAYVGINHYIYFTKEEEEGDSVGASLGANSQVLLKRVDLEAFDSQFGERICEKIGQGGRSLPSSHVSVAQVQLGPRTTLPEKLLEHPIEEFWVFLKGGARIKVGEQMYSVECGDTIRIPSGKNFQVFNRNTHTDIMVIRTPPYEPLQSMYASSAGEAMKGKLIVTE